VGKVHYINTMSNELDEHWLSETDVVGTCMDAEGYAAWIKAHMQQGCWFWHCDEQVLMYRSWPQAIIEQATEEGFFAWGL
jgi:hypothetical protein